MNLRDIKARLLKWALGSVMPAPPPRPRPGRKPPEPEHWEIKPWEKFKPRPETRDPAEDFARRLEKLAKKHYPRPTNSLGDGGPPPTLPDDGLHGR